ncbi:hypothetical protein, partial [Streptomyces sp. NPDC057302]|uniref:hypothetical protein n=1 Tax=Streptomyces sp. NPDC057302 TaxID=3346094 RepID=UPI0036316E3F
LTALPAFFVPYLQLFFRSFIFRCGVLFEPSNIALSPSLREKIPVLGNRASALISHPCKQLEF